MGKIIATCFDGRKLEQLTAKTGRVVFPDGTVGQEMLIGSIVARGYWDATDVAEGGPGSGHFGHAGRPGEVGGSAPSSGGSLHFKVDPSMFKDRRELKCDQSAVDMNIHRQPLSDEEWESVRYYTNYGYSEVNKILRGIIVVPKYKRNWRLYADARETTKYIDQLMERSRLTRDVIVYRGIGEGTMKKLERAKGKTFIDRGFVSTASNLRQLESYNRETGSRPYDYIIAIKVPKGTPAIWIGDKFGRRESELLLDRGLKFKYTKLTKRGTYEDFPYLVVQR